MGEAHGGTFSKAARPVYSPERLRMADTGEPIRVCALIDGECYAGEGRQSGA